jgi:glycosyltransferase involved in cell wall biosynthesis
MPRITVAITHTNFSLQWPRRLEVLRQHLHARQADLEVIEVTGHGGPYSFAGPGSANPAADHWNTLFGQDQKMESLAPAAVARRVWEALDRIRPDAVICGAVAFTPGATAVRWCRQRRRGVVVMDDARSVDVPRSRLVNAIKRRIYANVDAMLVPAPSHLDTCTHFGLPASRVFFGVDVVDNDWYAAEARRHRDARAREVKGVQLPERYFLGVGRQVPKKNWLTLVDAYARYRRDAVGPAWDLVLVGDGPERPAIAARVSDRAIPGVHLLPFLDPSKVPIAYANAGCLVLPSFYGETWGLVVNEAMASGLPVLVSEQCGCAQSLVNLGRNGWTFQPERVEELAILLGRLANLDDETRAQMGAHSAEVIADWSLDRFAAGASDAVAACLNVRRGFANPLDRVLLSLWKGRFRPT